MTLYPDNPLREGLNHTRLPDPTTLVIFGATGDLTARKLVPSLYNLAREGLMPHDFTVIGFARRDWSDDFFREQMHTGVREFSRTPIQDAVWQSFAQSLSFHQSNFDDDDGYARLKTRLEEIESKRGGRGNRLFYLATPPEYYGIIAEKLGTTGLSQHEGGETRIIIEKPFGEDLASAIELNKQVHSAFREEQVYRIDHYLGKETVQNIAVFRFANSIFEPLWNHKYVDHVQITVAENIGVENRANFYDKTGAVRDIIQNHVFQLMTLMAMEPPVEWEGEAVRDEKVKVLKSIRPLSPQQAPLHAVRGQYATGSSGGEAVPGYLEHPQVDKHSTTATFIAMKFTIENWRWSGVPFYLRTGKRLPKRVTEIAVIFKPTPLPMFGEAMNGLDPNALILRIQPDEGISLKFGSKLPGQVINIREVNMDFRYGTSFGVAAPDAYERLLLDSMLGDSKLFARSDEVIAAWKIIDPFFAGWALENGKAVPQYPAGTWGPQEADNWIEADGRHWRRL